MYEIGSFDEGFEARIILDVHVMELDAISPGEGLIEEVIDFLGGDVDDDGLVGGFGHELLAEV